MHRFPYARRAAVSAIFVLMTGLLVPFAHAASSTTTTTAPASGTTPRNALAAGAVEDSLPACLARIPKDATAGQRMIAEQSCRRDEGDRKPFQATLGR